MRGGRWLKVVNTLMLRGLGSGMAVLLTILVARHFDANDAARFYLVFNITTVASVCFRWGLDDVIVRRVAGAGSRGHGVGFAARLMRAAHHRVFMWTAVAIAAVGLVKLLRIRGVGEFDTTDLVVAVMASALIALTACAGRVIQALGRTNSAALILNILVPGLSVVGLLVILLAGLEIEASQLNLLYGLVSLAAYFAVVWGIPVTRPLVPTTGPDSEGARTALGADRKAANRLGGVVVAQQALNWGALLVVPAAYGDRMFTSFMVTYKVALLISLVMLAVNFTFSSRIAALYSRSEFSELQRLVKLMVLSVAAASVAAAAVVVAARGWIYSFSNVPVRLDEVLVVLVVGQAFFALAAVYALVLSMCRDEGYLLVAQGSVASVGLAVFLVVSFTSPLAVSAAAVSGTYAVLALILRNRAMRVIGLR